MHNTNDLDAAGYSLLRNQLTESGYIGGSMAAAVLGINPWMSKMKAWLMLSGMHGMGEENERMWCGRYLEPAVKWMFQDKTGMPVFNKPHIYQSKAHKHMITTLDGVVKEGDEEGVFEAKTTGAFNYKTWHDGAISDAAHTQVMHNLAVTGLGFSYVAVLIGGNRFSWARVERDERLIDRIIEEETKFYNSVKNHEPPEWEASDLDLLAATYPGGIEQLVELPPQAEDFAKQYMEAKAVIKEWDVQAKMAAAHLQAMMQNNNVAQIGNYRFSWKPITRRGYAVKETTYRQFRVSKRKE
jgi:putative phage-type endonuclease